MMSSKTSANYGALSTCTSKTSCRHQSLHERAARTTAANFTQGREQAQFSALGTGDYIWKPEVSPITAQTFITESKDKRRMLITLGDLPLNKNSVPPLARPLNPARCHAQGDLPTQYISMVGGAAALAMER